MHPVSQTIQNWYVLNKRDLPWRNTTNPYYIWLSEIILQQTRVEQGKPYYFNFIEKYPTVIDLANAPLQDVLKTWEGLGYYSRARNLHQTANIVAKDLNGIFPNNYNDLLRLKGIGSYTAAAISSFAYNEKQAVLDGNVFRVLSRVFGIFDDISQPKSKKKFQDLATELIENTHPALQNQSIMEFGALQCSPAPKCDSCPLTDLCYAFQNKKQQDLPVKIKKTKVKTVYFHYLVFEKEDKFLVKKRNSSSIWEGLYDFYLVEKEIEKFEISEIKELSEITLLSESKTYKHLLSHRKILAKFYHIKINQNIELENGIWVSKEEIKNLPKPVLIINYLNDSIFI